MWQRFTERARKVVFYAQEEAQKHGEGYVSTEHLLLGLIRETDTMAARVLQQLQAPLQMIQSEVEAQLPRGSERPSQGMTLTPRAKRVIDLAYDEARNLNNKFIGTEHLLLGLIREGDGLAGRVLAKLGVDLEGARSEVIALQAKEGVPHDPVKPHGKKRHPQQYAQQMAASHYRTLAQEYEKTLEAFHFRKIRDGKFVAEMLALMLLAVEDGEIRKVMKRLKVKVPKLVDAIEGAMLFTIARDRETSFQTILEAASKEMQQQFLDSGSSMGGAEFFLGILSTANPQLKDLFASIGINADNFSNELKEVRRQK